jgi:hypothetical protein
VDKASALFEGKGMGRGVHVPSIGRRSALARCRCVRFWKTGTRRWTRARVALEHLQPFEALGPKSVDIFIQIKCKTGMGKIFFPVVTPAFVDIVSK